MQLFVGVKAIVLKDAKVLLLRESSQYADGAETGKWDVPGGRIEAHETLEEGLTREVFEESGLTVRPLKLLEAFDGFPVIRGEKCHVVRLYFLCESNTDAVTLSIDHDAYEWVSLDSKFENMILVNDIAEVLMKVKEQT